MSVKDKLYVRKAFEFVNDREFDEPWHERWYRLFGVEPNMKERKYTTNNYYKRNFIFKEKY
jgi:hypothetical protein